MHVDKRSLQRPPIVYHTNKELNLEVVLVVSVRNEGVPGLGDYEFHNFGRMSNLITTTGM